MQAHPALRAKYPSFALTTDPDNRATFGCSSGGAAALTAAWLRPDLFRRVVAYSGTFVDQQDHEDKTGARTAYVQWTFLNFSGLFWTFLDFSNFSNFSTLPPTSPDKTGARTAYARLPALGVASPIGDLAHAGWGPFHPPHPAPPRPDPPRARQ